MRNNRERKSRLEERSKTHIVNEDILRYISHKKVILLDIEAIACLWIPFKPIHVITFHFADNCVIHLAYLVNRKKNILHLQRHLYTHKWYEQIYSYNTSSRFIYIIRQKFKYFSFLHFICILSFNIFR